MIVSSCEALKSCTMIIAERNKLVVEVHDRMRALFADEDFEAWLSGYRRIVEAGRRGPSAAPAGVEAGQQLEGPNDDPTLIDRV